MQGLKKLNLEDDSVHECTHREGRQDDEHAGACEHNTSRMEPRVEEHECDGCESPCQIPGNLCEDSPLDDGAAEYDGFESMRGVSLPVSIDVDGICCLPHEFTPFGLLLCHSVFLIGESIQWQTLHNPKTQVPRLETDPIILSCRPLCLKLGLAL